jgi:hypothetical protein
LPFVTILASPATQTKREASTADEPQRVGRSLLAMEDEEAFDFSTTSIVVVGLVAAVAAVVVVTALRHQRQREHDELNFV